MSHGMEKSIALGYIHHEQVGFVRGEFSLKVGVEDCLLHNFIYFMSLQNKYTLLF
jgi:hypothetical protein